MSKNICCFFAFSIDLMGMMCGSDGSFGSLGSHGSPVSHGFQSLGDPRHQ